MRILFSIRKKIFNCIFCGLIDRSNKSMIVKFIAYDGYLRGCKWGGLRVSGQSGAINGWGMKGKG